jgi:hypothetical protein
MIKTTVNKYLLLFFGLFLFIDGVRLHFGSQRLVAGSLNPLWYISYLPATIGAIFFLTGLSVKIEGEEKVRDIALSFFASALLVAAFMYIIRLH